MKIVDIQLMPLYSSFSTYFGFLYVSFRGFKDFDFADDRILDAVMGDNGIKWNLFCLKGADMEISWILKC